MERDNPRDVVIGNVLGLASTEGETSALALLACLGMILAGGALVLAGRSSP